MVMMFEAKNLIISTLTGFWASALTGAYCQETFLYKTLGKMQCIQSHVAVHKHKYLKDSFIIGTFIKVMVVEFSPGPEQ